MAGLPPLEGAAVVDSLPVNGSPSSFRAGCAVQSWVAGRHERENR